MKAKSGKRYFYYEKFVHFLEVRLVNPKLNIAREKTNQLTFKTYKNDFCNFQFHSQIEIYAVKEGEMNMLVDGKQKTLKSGELLVALSYSGHDYRTPQYSRSFAIIIPTNLCEEFMQEIDGKKLKSPFFDDKELFDKIETCYNAIKDENTSIIKKHGLVNVVLGLILENGEFVDCNASESNKLISKILVYVNENYKSDISPNDVSQHFGYSQSYISRAFKLCVGITLIRYITILRLHNAVALMNESGNNISFCALESGFDSIRTFYRAFRNEFGCSPRDYLKRMK